MVNAIPIIQLQLYVNPVLHYLVPPAVICIITTRGVTNKEELSADYYRLRKLLIHEFFHLENTEEVTFDAALQYCVRNAVTSPTWALGTAHALHALLRAAVTPALCSLHICAEVMAQYKRCEHKQALKLVQERVENGRYHPYCLSLEAANNCLQGLTLYGALTKQRSKEQVTYEAVPLKLEECRRLISSVLPKCDVDFGKNNSVILNQDDVKAKL